MLTQIYVKNFILIDEVQLSLYPHMSAFTGETGAGKSLLLKVFLKFLLIR